MDTPREEGPIKRRKLAASTNPRHRRSRRGRASIRARATTQPTAEPGDAQRDRRPRGPRPQLRVRLEERRVVLRGSMVPTASQKQSGARLKLVEHGLRLAGWHRRCQGRSSGRWDHRDAPASTCGKPMQEIGHASSANRDKMRRTQAGIEKAVKQDSDSVPCETARPR